MSGEAQETHDEDETWNWYNSLLLSRDVDRVRKLLVRYDLYRLAQHVPGDIVECGVFKGVGLMYWLKLLAIYEPASTKKVVGFDTFDRFADSYRPYEKSAVDRYVKEAHFQGVTLEALHAYAEAMGSAKRLDLVAGDLLLTAEEYVAAQRGFRISLLNLDVDTYDGTRAALEAFYPVVSRGGVIILDEYATRGWGESDAVDEFLQDKAIELRAIPYSTKPVAYFVKP